MVNQERLPLHEFDANILPLSRSGLIAAAAALLLALPILPALAQSNGLVTIGSVQEDRIRLAQILGTDSADGFLLRTASTLTPAHAGAGGQLQLGWLEPDLRTVWNSAIPFSLDDGAMWAGRGTNFFVTTGLLADYGRWHLVLAPAFTYSQNLPFQVFPGTEPSRSSFSSPWHTGAGSADLPLRFGDQGARLLDLGQSSITFDAGPVAAGASTEDQWWGPGIRNAIVMSDNAEGIPHLFLRTTRPVKTPFGDLEARWIIGGLTESLYFDTLGANGLRSLSGLVVTLRPGQSRHLTLGLARVVYGEASSRLQILGRLFDVVTQYGRTAPTDSIGHRDQLTSLFGRWIFPASGLEIYAEWAREELPQSLRDFLLDPHRSQGYTVGGQWVRPAGEGGAVVRLQAELTDLEQSIAIQGQAPPPDYYTGGATAQGYTQRGKVIGAAIGPGASSEWLAGDYVAPRWQAGLFIERVRWENDALYRQPNTNYYRHDVSLLAGARGAVRLARWDASATLTAGRRYNYLFQNALIIPGARTVDITNYTLSFAIAPR